MKRFVFLFTLLSVLFSILATSGFAGEPEYLYVIAKSGLWMRETPEPTGKQIVLIPYNSKVKFLERKKDFVKIAGISSNWLKVDLNGKTGWVFGGFVSWADANHSVPADLFGGWVKDKTKNNGLRYNFDVSGMGIMYIYGRDATDFKSFSIEEWELKGDAYLMKFRDNGNKLVIYSVILDSKSKTLTVTEEGYSTVQLIRE